MGNNPGIESGDELTPTQETFLKTMANATYATGDSLTYSGSAFQRSPSPKMTVTGVDAKTTGSTLIGTTDSTLRFRPVRAIFEITSATAVVGVATVSVGTNASSYNNVLVASALTGLSTVNTSLIFNLSLAVLTSITVSTGIYVNVTIGATATTCVFKVSVIGDYD